MSDENDFLHDPFTPLARDLAAIAGKSDTDDAVKKIYDAFTRKGSTVQKSFAKAFAAKMLRFSPTAKEHREGIKNIQEISGSLIKLLKKHGRLIDLEEEFFACPNAQQVDVESIISQLDCLESWAKETPAQKMQENSGNKGIDEYYKFIFQVAKLYEKITPKKFTSSDRKGTPFNPSTGYRFANRATEFLNKWLERTFPVLADQYYLKNGDCPLYSEANLRNACEKAVTRLRKGRKK